MQTQTDLCFGKHNSKLQSLESNVISCLRTMIATPNNHITPLIKFKRMMDIESIQARTDNKMFSHYKSPHPF